MPEILQFLNTAPGGAPWFIKNPPRPRIRSALAGFSVNVRSRPPAVFNKCKVLYNLPMKRYNMVEAAKLLRVTRQTLYNWINRGWIKPGRDYRNYPVFTEADMRKIKNWKETIR